MYTNYDVRACDHKKITGFASVIRLNNLRLKYNTNYYAYMFMYNVCFFEKKYYKVEPVLSFIYLRT